MSAAQRALGFFATSAALSMVASAHAACEKVQSSPQSYEHAKFAPEPDILREFRGFTVSFDSKDDDDGDSKADLLRVPHWVAQELRRWEPSKGQRADDKAWCIDTLKPRPSWFVERALYESGVAPSDGSYRGSGFNRGHMAMKPLVERLDQDAACNTFTLLNAIPQRPKFNQSIWEDLERLTGAWAQTYGKIWIIQGPVFYPGKVTAWIGDEGERKVAVPDAVFKIVIRNKTEGDENAASCANNGAHEVMAFLYPQLGPGYFGSKEDYRHASFLTTVDEIEVLTGLRFKNLCPPSIKSQRATQLWDLHPNQPKRKLFVPACRAKKSADNEPNE